MCTVTFVCIVVLWVLLLLLSIMLLLCIMIAEYSSCYRLQFLHIAGWCCGAIYGMPNALFRYVVAWVLT
jgi:hypothetical protein